MFYYISSSSIRAARIYFMLQDSGELGPPPQGFRFNVKLVLNQII